MPQIYRNDAVLIRKISDGDIRAFNELYKKHWKTVYRQAYKRLSDCGKAKDITQDIFCKIWTRRTSIDINNLESYLYIAVKNRVLNLYEKEKRVIPVEYLLKRKYAADQADKLTLQNEFTATYKSLVKRLPSKRRKIFIQHYELGSSTKEIAEQLCISQKTVQNQLCRAATFLRSELTHLLILVVILLL